GRRIAEVQHALRLAENAHTHTANASFGLAAALDLAAEGPHRLRGVESVLAFKQAGNACLAHRERAEDQGPMGNGFVARNLGMTPQRAGTARGQGSGGRLIQGSLVVRDRPSYHAPGRASSGPLRQASEP